MSFVADTAALDFEEAVTRGRRLWAALQGDVDFDTIIAECGRYAPDWKAARGSMALPGINLQADGPAYVAEGLKLMVINTVAGGMVVAPSSVDAAMHAATAQLDLCRSLRERVGLAPEHRTLEESTMPSYAAGCFTDKLYTAIFGEEPPRRFWMDQATIDRNFDLVAKHLLTVGIDLHAGAVDPDAFERLERELTPAA